jgi:ElaB/YqjD/DUF883 family membrane-anchored ribosome-binding protein
MADDNLQSQPPGGIPDGYSQHGDVSGAQPTSELGESPDRQEGCHTVRSAKEEIQRAREVYDDLCRQASDRLRRVRETTLGEVMECGLEAVRKHPGRGVIVAGLLGFFLGRLFRH